MIADIDERFEADRRVGDYVDPSVLLGDVSALSQEDIALELAVLLSCVSEDTHCATWMMGLEHAARSWADGPGDGPHRYGMGDVEPDVVRALRRARDLLDGGWVRYGRDGVEWVDAAMWHRTVDGDPT